MINAHSQRILQPYSAQVQIAQSDRARAVTADGERWEFQFLFSRAPDSGARANPEMRRMARVANIRSCDLSAIAEGTPTEHGSVDERIRELARFLVGASLPFPAVDHYEYWLLDPKDDTPLALIFSCSDTLEMDSFPHHPEWQALPAAVMPIETSEAERRRSYGPVNYRLERCVAERAGQKPKAQWFKRRVGDTDDFPPLLVREDWESEECRGLCQRYLQRQAPRLLMLHGISSETRRRMELASQANVLDVARFYPLYPEIADAEVMGLIRVEARLRMAAGEQAYALQNRGGML